MIISERLRVAEDLISDFRNKFIVEVGVDPVVTYSFKVDSVSRISLSELEKVVNEIFKKNFPELYPEDGIRSKFRRSMIVAFRFIFFKIAREMCYPLVPIAKFLGYNHATVLHAVKTINNYIDTRDVTITTYYNLVKYEIQTRIDYNATISDTEQQGDNS